MCGIAGVLGTPQPTQELLKAMGSRMAHRGPDSQGVWLDGAVGLAVRRLAIIDLDPRSNQPLHLGHWHLAFNGEIYNYRELRRELEALGHGFETEGDGEVLLHAWAEWEDGALDRLNGMFAFAVWHDERQELVCARDPFGEKPLFWAGTPHSFVFASEIRTLLVARPDLRTPDHDALCAHLAYGRMPPIEQTFFAGINQLPAAHTLRVSHGRVDVREYWRPQRTDVPRRYEDAAVELKALLADSIRLRLRSDVSIGTSLSGGVDSSAVVCLAAQIAGDHRRHAFTARFPGFERDEWRYAASVAQAAGVTEHHSVEPTASGFLDELETIVTSQEEPFGSASIYAQWCVMRAAFDARVIVLLDGQGADELFGGYGGIDGWALRSSGPAAVARGLASRDHRFDLVLALGSGRVPKKLSRWHLMRQVTPYLEVDLRESVTRYQPQTFETKGFRSPLARELLRQAFHTSMPQLLRFADRNSMAHSREVRLPFLDKRIAQFAFSLPAAFLYRDGVKKAILRDAVRGLVPSVVLNRTDKVGYEPPQSSWLAEPAFVNKISDVLLDPAARGRGLYSTREVEADARTGQWRDSAGIMRALNIELWLRAFEHQ